MCIQIVVSSSHGVWLIPDKLHVAGNGGEGVLWKKKDAIYDQEIVIILSQYLDVMELLLVLSNLLTFSDRFWKNVHNGNSIYRRGQYRRYYS